MEEEEEKEKEKERKKKRGFVEGVEQALDVVKERFPMDTVADRMMLRFMHERLPPPAELIDSAKALDETVEMGIHLYTTIKPIAGGIARTVSPGEKGNHTYLVHCLANHCKAADRKDRWKWLSEDMLAITDEEANAIDFILRQYPQDVTVRCIPLQDENDRVALAESLVDLNLCRATSQLIRTS